jgi:hypothetical protein
MLAVGGHFMPSLKNAWDQVLKYRKIFLRRKIVPDEQPEGRLVNTS